MPVRLSPAEILEKLVSFPTVPNQSNLDLVDWVADYLRQFGIEIERFYNPERDKAAILAHIGPQTPGGVVLSGHTDVVSIKGQNWDSDPFTLTQKDGRLYGRGACDMKGFDALAIWAIVEAADAPLQRPLQLALSYDEEQGCTGAPPMIDHMLGIFPKAESVIVGEPTMMNLVDAHKGGLGLKTHVRGFEIHSSLIHQGVSAVMEAAKLINWANEQNVLIQTKTSSAIAKRFDPPFSNWHVGMVTGGTANNITAKDCHFMMSLRALPDETFEELQSDYTRAVDDLRSQMQKIHPETDITIEEVYNVPSLRPEPDGAAARLVRRITGANDSQAVSFGTEAGQFQERGYSVVVCGPGDIAVAHQPNESLSLAQLAKGQAFMQKLIEDLGA